MFLFPKAVSVTCLLPTPFPSRTIPALIGMASSEELVFLSFLTFLLPGTRFPESQNLCENHCLCSVPHTNSAVPTPLYIAYCASTSVADPHILQAVDRLIDCAPLEPMHQPNRDLPSAISSHDRQLEQNYVSCCLVARTTDYSSPTPITSTIHQVHRFVCYLLEPTTRFG